MESSAQGAEEIIFDRGGFGKVVAGTPEVGKEILHGVLHLCSISCKVIPIVVQHSGKSSVHFTKGLFIVLPEGIP